MVLAERQWGASPKGGSGAGSGAHSTGSLHSRSGFSLMVSAKEGVGEREEGDKRP